MQLSNLLQDLTGPVADKNVTGFAIDHRQVAQGNIFGAFKGGNFNAEDYIADAVAAGAVAIVARGEASVSGAHHIVSDCPRRDFARLAAKFYAPVPANVAAITGTNGKTSVAELTRQLWYMSGHSAASIGTLGITTASGQEKTGLTSPDIVTFLSNMAGLAKEGVSHVAYEASSHGLHQYRNEGLPVEIAAFTNLSRDHLDYHGSMDEYFAAKMRLFDEVVVRNGTAVIWADDAWSEKAICHAEKRGLRLFLVGENGHSIRVISRETTKLGQIIKVEYNASHHTISLPLIGAYQAANALIAIGIAIASGDDALQTLSNVQRLQPVRGRLERAVITRAGAPVYVDYAHTPDALSAAIDAIRPHVTGRLITIFGAGGNRDTGKRPEMGRVVTMKSDIAVVTDDNPRDEDASAIRADIVTAAPGALEIADRREAIAEAMRIAEAGDIILLAGKGHEEGQIIGKKTIPFNDVQVARECAV